MFARKLRIYEGLKEELENFNPDIIFLHDIQFLDVITIINYVKNRSGVKVFADGHTDFINSARNWLSKNILHKIIYKWCAKRLEPYVNVFFGVTPLRAKFFEEVYGINKNKIDLLVMGYDDSEPLAISHENIRKKTRLKLNIDESDFLIVTGGKIDIRKNIHFLLSAFIDLNLPRVKILVFGMPTPELEEEIKRLCLHENIIHVGWSSQSDIRDYLLSSDVAFYPGTHSVIWEQTVGLGVPAVFRKWNGMTHVDVGGNCLLLDNGDEQEIKSTITFLIENEELLIEMSSVARSRGKLVFSYSEIAKKAIGLS